jgi:hypothetical protein
VPGKDLNLSALTLAPKRSQPCSAHSKSVATCFDSRLQSKTCKNLDTSLYHFRFVAPAQSEIVLFHLLASNPAYTRLFKQRAAFDTTLFVVTP